MNIQLCSNTSENNTINKKISVISSVDAVIKGAISMEKPVLILQYDGSVDDINYVIINEFGRKYFITDLINLTGGRYEIHTKVDVLESFKNKILNLNCIVNKQSGRNNSNMYYNDNSYITQCTESNFIINFNNGFLDNGEFILITAGGGGSIA